KIARITGPTLAILNRVFVAVDFDRIAGRIDTGRQRPIRSPRAPKTRDLPTTDQMLHDAFGISQQLLAAPNRHVHEKIPTNLVLEAVRPARVIQETQTRIEIRWHRPRQKRVDAGDGIGAWHIDVVPPDPDRIPYVPENLVCESLAEAPLQFEFHAVV